jgi:RimJ/RimL family protein N-acetyltransferase
MDLRRFVPSDLDELAGVFAHPEVWQFPFGRAFTRDETEAFLGRQLDHWDSRGFGCWVVRTLEDGCIVGYAGLSVPFFLPEILPHVEVGWRFMPSVWGRGYATEAATAALDEAFTTLGLERVCSIPQSDNTASWRVCERLGLPFVREVTIPANELRGELRARFYETTAERWMRR